MFTSGLAAPVDERPPATPGWQPLLAVALALALLAGWSIHREFERQRAEAGSRLQAQAEVYAAQFERWLAHQLALASFIGSGTHDAELLAPGRALHEAADLRALVTCAAALRRELDGAGVLLFDAQGDLLAADPGDADDGGDPLRAAIRTTIATGKPGHTGIYRRDGSPAPVGIDFELPLARAGLPAAGAVALRVDARRVLFPMLARWPGASATGEALRWHQAGDRIALISDVRHLPDKAGPLSEAWSTSILPAARLLRGEIKPGEVVFTPDYRGSPCWPRCSRCRAATGCWWPRSTAPRSTRPRGAWSPGPSPSPC
jgi:hypothetical protein